MAHLNGKDRVLWGKAGPLYNSKGEVTGAIESIRDFTERRRLEDSIMQMNRKLQLLSSITRHDILNNITVCRGYLAMAKRKSPEPKIQEHLDLLESIIGKIHSQIVFTRVYQDLGAALPEWQKIDELVLDNAGSCGIPVISEISEHEVFADKLIGKVFSNLIDNTVRHGRHATEIHVWEETHDDNIVIFWGDNGIGIPPSEKEIIFDHGFGSNTGLGLFLAREILSITGITIAETGEPGKGARFEITVPKGMWRIGGSGLMTG
jgi:signal transduction histidine kinase